MQAAGVKEIKYPLTACQKMAMMRNIEKMISDALNDHREVIELILLLCPPSFSVILLENNIKSVETLQSFCHLSLAFFFSIRD